MSDNESLAGVEEGIFGPRTERLNYGVSCDNVDFRTLKARNQLIAKVIGPLMDKIMIPLEKDRHEGAGTRYTVNLVIVSKIDIDSVQ